MWCIYSSPVSSKSSMHINSFFETGDWCAKATMFFINSSVRSLHSPHELIDLRAYNKTCRGKWPYTNSLSNLGQRLSKDVPNFLFLNGMANLFLFIATSTYVSSTRGDLRHGLSTWPRPEHVTTGQTAWPCRQRTWPTKSCPDPPRD